MSIRHMYLHHCNGITPLVYIGHTGYQSSSNHTELLNTMISNNSISFLCTHTDHSLDYYQFPTETKDTGLLHDIEAPNIEDAEDDEDYEENSFPIDKSNSLDKLKSDQKIR